MAMFVLGAVAASAASAASPAWWVAGTLLKGTEAISETTTVTKAFSITANSYGVECGSVALEGASIEAEKTAKFKAIAFGGCKVLESSSCTVPTTIKTEPLTATLEGTTGHFKLNFAPTTMGKPLVVIKFSGAKCALETATLTGTMACNYPGVETEAIIHELEFTATSGSHLKEGSLEVKLAGIDDFWLTPEKKWSVH
ncbi:MAG TPA: hypothetical protein VGL57_09025 [Solirubrobacteraceae bacterium]